MNDADDGLKGLKAKIITASVQVLSATKSQKQLLHKARQLEESDNQSWESVLLLCSSIFELYVDARVTAPIKDCIIQLDLDKIDAPPSVKEEFKSWNCGEPPKKRQKMTILDTDNNGNVDQLDNSKNKNTNDNGNSNLNVEKTFSIDKWNNPRNPLMRGKFGQDLPDILAKISYDHNNHNYDSDNYGYNINRNLKLLKKCKLKQEQWSRSLRDYCDKYEKQKKKKKKFVKEGREWTSIDADKLQLLKSELKRSRKKYAKYVRKHQEYKKIYHGKDERSSSHGRSRSRYSQDRSLDSCQQRQKRGKRKGKVKKREKEKEKEAASDDSCLGSKDNDDEEKYGDKKAKSKTKGQERRRVSSKRGKQNRNKSSKNKRQGKEKNRIKKTRKKKKMIESGSHSSSVGSDSNVDASYSHDSAHGSYSDSNSGSNCGSPHTYTSKDNSNCQGYSDSCSGSYSDDQTGLKAKSKWKIRSSRKYRKHGKTGKNSEKSKHGRDKRARGRKRNDDKKNDKIKDNRSEKKSTADENGKIKQKQHKCSQCKKEFSQKSDLKRHQRVHDKHKPYICKLCPEQKTFTQSGSLYRHLKKKHGKSKEDKDCYIAPTGAQIENELLK